MTEDDMKRFWFYQTPAEVKKPGGPRIKQFMEIGWVDPFASAQMGLIQTNEEKA